MIVTKFAALNTVQKLGNSSLVLDFNSPQLNTDGSNIFGQTSQTSYRPATYISLHSIAMP